MLGGTDRVPVNPYEYEAQKRAHIFTSAKPVAESPLLAQFKKPSQPTESSRPMTAPPVSRSGSVPPLRTTAPFGLAAVGWDCPSFRQIHSARSQHPKAPSKSDSVWRPPPGKLRHCAPEQAQIAPHLHPSLISQKHPSTVPDPHPVVSQRLSK